MEDFRNLSCLRPGSRRAACLFLCVVFVGLPHIDSARPVFPVSSSSEVIPVSQGKDSDTARVNALIRHFNDKISGDLSGAEQLAREALALSERINFARGLADSHRSLGDVHRIKGNYAQAEDHIRQSISVAEYLDDNLLLAKGYFSMFRLFFFKGDYVKAGEFNDIALAIGEENSSPLILADAYSNAGMLLGSRGNHVEAIEYFIKSLEMFRAQSDELQAGLTLMRIGHTFELAGSYEKALDYLFQSLEVNKKLNSTSNIGWCLLNIGVTYSRIIQDDDSLKLHYYHEALRHAEEAGDFRLTLACLDNIGGAYSIRKDFASANAYLMKAYRLSQAAGHNSRTVYITGNLAENFLYAGKLDSALLFGLQNLRIARAENNTFEKEQAYSVLSQVYAAQGAYSKAYEMLLSHITLSDSLFNVQKSRQIEDLREKYEADKKEQEITTLTQQKATAEFRRNAFAVLAVLFLLIAFLVFYVLRLRVKRNQARLQREIELDRMKSRFFANISHEFRTPLTLILGPIDDLMERNSGDAAMVRYLQPVKKNASRLLELVNQLLELSRIESGKLKITLAKIDIMSLVKGVVMSFESLAAMKQVSLDVHASPASLAIYIDRDKLEKILTNLLSNAFKFTPEGGRISVSIRRAEGPAPALSECLQISVADSGSGIPQQELDHIFDRFYQADNNQLHQQDGSGIGLALTKELVEMQHGRIWAVSGVNQGTTIHIQIPLQLQEILKDCVAEAPSFQHRQGEIVSGADFVSVEQTVKDDGEEHRSFVLVIEDHPDVRNYIRNILAPIYEVVEADDGEQGVSLALEKIPDLILCDVMMPKMNGNEVCARLKSDERTSHVPIILLTAKADLESRIEGLETKADDYLTKPFVPKELLVRISNLIESRRTIREKYRKTLTLGPSEITVDSVDEKFMKRVAEVLESHIADESFSVESLGREVGMSRSQLHRKLKGLTGEGPNQLIRSFRLHRAHELLKGNAATAAEIAYAVGFGSPSYFTKCFHEHFGYTPTEAGDR